jgi:hypothetical protein
LLSGYYIVNAYSGKVLDDPAFSTSNGTPIQQYQLNGLVNQRWDFVPLAGGNDLIVNKYSGKVLDDPAFSTANGAVIQQSQRNGLANQQWKLVALADGNYEVRNTYSGKVLDDPVASNSNGALIQQWQPSGYLNQQWMLLAASDDPVVTYYVANAYSGKVLDDPAFSSSNGTQIQQYQLNGLVNQRWDFVPLADGHDLIVNASSGKVLDDPAFSTSDGALIQQWQPNGYLNQQWDLAAPADGKWELVNAYSGKALDDPAFSTANGAIIQQYQLNGLANQQWTLLAASAAPAVTNYVVNNWSGKVLDDPAFSTSNGTQIQQYQYEGLANQQWTFVPLADGHDLIVNAYSGNVLDDPAFSTANGAIIQQWQPNGYLNQQWDLVALYGKYEVRNAYSGKALDDPAFSTSNGALIRQWQPSGYRNQLWVLFDAANGGADTSGNWSGYVAATNLASPQANSVSAVSGSWIVPTVTGPSSGSTYSATWVGIDGFGNSTVEQIGTEQDVINGVTTYDAWWEMYSSKGAKVAGQGYEAPINTMTILPGDSITASVQYISSGTHAGQFYLSIVDNSRSKDSFSTYQTSAQTQNPTAQRSMAEWIVEPPTVNNSVASLANFGSVTFTNASATISGVSGAINASGWQSRAINMTSGSTTLDRTSVLTNSGTTFVVIDTPPPAAASAAVQSGPNVAAKPQAGQAVGTFLQSGKSTSSPVIGGPLGAAASGRSRFRRPVGQLQSKVYLSALPRRSQVVFDEGDAKTSDFGKDGIF